MDVANPDEGATDIHGAAAAIGGILEAEESPTKEDTADQAKPDEESETELEAADEESETEEPEAEESKDEKPEEDDGEPTDTLEALAKVLDTDVDVLTSQLNVPIKIDGETSQVTLQEALNGYQRDADYQRKMTEVGEKRRELEAAETSALERLQPKFEQLNALIETMNGDEFTEERFQQILSAEGVEAAMLARSRHDAKAQVLKEAVGLRDGEIKQHQAKQAEEFQAFVQQEQVKVLERIPALKDEAKAKTLKSDMRTYLLGNDFSESEISELVDSRFAKVAYDAMRYSAVQKAKPEIQKKLKSLPRVLKGAKGPPARQDKRVAQSNRLKRTGRVDDAAKLLEGFV